MTCRDFIEFLTEYLAGELSDRERFIFEAHLAVCPSCVAYLNTYRETLAFEQAAFADDEPTDAPEELVQAILLARGTN